MKVLLSGEGNKDNPYKISSVEDLVYLSENKYLSSERFHFIQTSDIDMREINFHPIGNFDLPFKGFFSGSGFHILNLTINQDKTGVGLFGFTDFTAVIDSVILYDVNITGYDGVGGVVGCNEGGKFYYCEVTGTITATVTETNEKEVISIGITAGANYDDGLIYGCIGECVLITAEKKYKTDEKIIGYNLGKFLE